MTNNNTNNNMLQQQQQNHLRFRSAKERSRTMSANIYSIHSNSSNNTGRPNKRRKILKKKDDDGNNDDTDVDDQNNNNNDFDDTTTISRSKTNSMMTTTVISNHYTNINKNHMNIITQVLAVSNREQYIHFPTTTKQQQMITTTTTTLNDSGGIIMDSKQVPQQPVQNLSSSSSSSNTTLSTTSITTDIPLLAIELDVCYERNKSEIFTKFYYSIWNYIRSLPEMIHHLSIIIDIINQYIVTTTVVSTTTTTMTMTTNTNIQQQQNHYNNNYNNNYTINYATMDILHLLGVLCREVRYEIHPYIHSKILPTILYHILQLSNPNHHHHQTLQQHDATGVVGVGTTTKTNIVVDITTSTGTNNDQIQKDDDDKMLIDNNNDDDDDDDDVKQNDDTISKQQQQQNDENDIVVDVPSIPNKQHQNQHLDVAIIEYIFRIISFILKYDQLPILQDITQPPQQSVAAGGGGGGSTHNTSSTTTTNTTTTINTENNNNNNIENRKHTTNNMNSSIIPCCDQLRIYYGSTICHPHNIFIRRLAAETFAPIIRQLHIQQHILIPSTSNSNVKRSSSSTSKKKNPFVRHITRTLRALSYNRNDETISTNAAVQGIAYYLYEISCSNNNKYQLHTKCGMIMISTLLDILLEYSITDIDNDTDNTNNNRSIEKTKKKKKNQICYNRIIVIRVIQMTFQLWCQNLQPDYIITILDTVITTIMNQYVVTKKTINQVQQDTTTTIVQQKFVGLRELLCIVQYYISYKNGTILVVHQQKGSNKSIKVLDLLQKLFSLLQYNVFTMLDGTCQIELLQVVYTLLRHTLVSSQDNNTAACKQFYLQLVQHLCPLLTVPIIFIDKDTDTTTTIVVAYHVVQHCIPYLLSNDNNNIQNQQRIMSSIGSAILIALMEWMSSTKDDHDDPFDIMLTTLHGMVSVRSCNIDDSVDNHCDVLFLDRAIACSNIPQHSIDVLLNQILDVGISYISTTSNWNSRNSVDAAAKIVAICKVSSFLAVVGLDSGTEKSHNDWIDDDNDDDHVRTRMYDDEAIQCMLNNYKRVSNFHIRLLQHLDVSLQNSTDIVMKDDGHTVMSMAIESISKLTNIFKKFWNQKSDSSSTKAINSTIQVVHPIVLRHLLGNPNKLWVLKSAATFFSSYMSYCDISDDHNLIETLLPCLRSRYHFHRLPALQILSSLPKRPYVIDHADLDLTDDLDEEHDGIVASRSNKVSSYVGLSGPCNILELLLAIEMMPVNMQNERTLLSNIARIGVLGRTGKLPIIYAEAAVSHMLGLLHIKFAPIWPVAIKSLVDLSIGYENFVWPAIHSQIAHYIELYPPQVKQQQMECDEVDDNATPDEKIIEMAKISIEPTAFYDLCRVWESSNGINTSLFAHDIRIAEDRGYVSRHHSTDESSVVASLWSVMQGNPKLITAHSRTIVPIFLRFILHQYYAIHLDDPDSREIDISTVLNEMDDRDEFKSNNVHLNKKELNGRQVQQRLLCIVKAFASVNGPQQLFHHKTLLPVFVSFLGSQDNFLSQAALAFVLKFKLPYLVPYGESLKKLYEKGKLRDAMMQLNAYVENGKLSSDHRVGLIPILSRILFGRLSARSGGVKSSKDSPAARRSAIVSFLSSFCQTEDELYPFLYLMIRVYIPTSYKIRPVELHDKVVRNEILQAIVNSTTDNLTRIPVQVHQGFLNVLDAVISQLGRKLVSFVSPFISIIIKLCKTYEVKTKSTSCEGRVSEERDDTEDFHSPSDRIGSIRSLCYARLANIFSNFSDVCDLSVYSAILWEALDHSLGQLPVMVLNSEKVPSLLNMIRIMSGEESLVSMLKEKENIIPSVLQCLSDSSKSAVVEAVLAIIDNLLDFKNGRKLLQVHVDMMLDQFVSRMGNTTSLLSSRSTTQKSNLKGQPTWRKELTILCKVSELINETMKRSISINCTKAMESMCILLVPFLDINRGIPDSDKQKILDILQVMIVNVSPDAAVDHFANIAILLGPFKAKSGINSRGLRKSLATVLSCIADTLYPAAKLSTNLLNRLCAVSTKRIEEMDYDVAIPAIGELGNVQGESNWLTLCNYDNNGSMEPSVLLPLVYTCFNFLSDDDGVVSRGSFNALNSLVATSSSESNKCVKWRKLLEGCIIPLIKSGLSSHVEFVRRFYILLLKEVVQRNVEKSANSFFSDLYCLIRDDEPDLDFFLNITHVQLHRRARALQRLRKSLVLDPNDPESSSLSLQSLSGILLPLATHPIYESKTKLEESFALEGIATVGAISRHLSWSKYNTLIWNHLSQFERHPELEKYLIGLICAIIDGFHFQVFDRNNSDETVGKAETANTSSIWRALENRIIPKIEKLMIKEKTDKKCAMLRPSVVLALHKLIQKLPTEMFQAKLPRLLAVVCDALTKRESDARDIARASLAKMVVEMDMVYLCDVLRELATSLTEGYKLYVLGATIHTILLEISKVYTPPKTVDLTCLPAFDRAVPALMDLIQQDIFGETQERKDVQGASQRLVKEAGGSKSSHSLELIATMILFRPSMQMTLSSVHVMITPFLARLRSAGTSTTAVRRIRESLSRIVTGLLRNPTIQGDAVINFVYATLVPFVSGQEIESVMEQIDDDYSSDDDDNLKPIQVSGKRKLADDNVKVQRSGYVVEWRPSTLKTLNSSKAAHEAKSIEEKKAYLVQDGASAPKLTGSARMTTATTSSGYNSVNDTVTVCAVVFGLQLLSPTLKKLTECETEALDRFIPLLTTCVCRCRNTDVVLLALRCLGWLLRSDLPSFARCSKALATKTLDLMISAGSNQELLQATFKMLTFLISFDRKDTDRNYASSSVGLASKTLPLNDDQLQVLISFLQESVVTTDQHNAAISLIKAIMSRRYISVEFYDLMETVLQQSVRSSKATLRDQSGVLFLHYLINYPLSAEKIEQHLKQVVLNLSYEYAEGRTSAINLASLLVDKLPVPIIEQHHQLFFFPLTLQLVNDDSKDCRESVAKCLGKLFKCLSMETTQSIFGYIKRWSNGDSALQRMSLQLFSIFVEVRPDFVKRKDTAKTIVSVAQSLMEQHEKDWEIQYFSLILLESMTNNFNHLVVQRSPLWQCVIECMVNEHVWVKLASLRLLSKHLLTLDPNNMTHNQTFILANDPSGVLFRIARNLCYQLGIDESQQNDDITSMAVKTLTFIIQAAATYPNLCITGSSQDEIVRNDDTSDDDHDGDSDVVDVDNTNTISEEVNTSLPNPVQWIITRLSNLARLKGTKRRQSIFKCFAAFVTLIPNKDTIIYPHLERMIEPLHRVVVETKNDTGGGNTTNYLILLSKRSTDTISEEGQLAKDVLQLLESNCTNNEYFIQAYYNVQTRYNHRKEQRKVEKQIQVITNPTFAAQQRVQKQIREKSRRQRRIQERRSDHGRRTTKHT